MQPLLIIGSGHNGLTAAFYLAKAGLKPIVLEARETVGGGAITGELHPGFRGPTLAHHTWIWSDIAREMELRRHGLEPLTPHVDVFAPSPDGPPVVIYDDAARTAESLRPLSARDAVRYPAYRASIEGVARVLASVFTSPPPDIDNPTPRDLWNLLRAGRAFRALGRPDGYRLLRWIPMPVADLVREWFETDALCAATAAPGLSGTLLAPRSGGSGLVLLMQEANRLLAQRSCRVRGGPGALTRAMAAAARAAGAEIRTGTRVERILVDGDAVAGVVANGAELRAATVLSAIDPKTTFLRLVDPADLTPEFRLKIGNYRASGSVAKVNLALAALPSFTGAAGDGAPAETLSGRIHLGPGLDYLERAFDHAKYRELPEHPWLDATIPSILDPDLAPRGAHVMSIYVHYATYALRGGWNAAREPLLAAVVRTLEQFAPGIGPSIVAAQVITPAEMEADYGFPGGHIFHGELALDQLFTMRPLLGYGRYAGPIRGLYLCSAGTHPGGFLTGASGRLAARQVLKTLKGARA